MQLPPGLKQQNPTATRMLPACLLSPSRPAPRHPGIPYSFSAKPAASRAPEHYSPQVDGCQQEHAVAVFLPALNGVLVAGGHAGTLTSTGVRMAGVRQTLDVCREEDIAGG